MGRPVLHPSVSCMSYFTALGRTVSSKSKSLTSTARSAVISTSARRRPRHSRGPALKFTNSNAEGRCLSNHRSGRKTSASPPQRSAHRPCAYGENCRMQPAGTTVPSGSVSAPTACLKSTGTDGWRRRPSSATAFTYLRSLTCWYSIRPSPQTPATSLRTLPSTCGCCASSNSVHVRHWAVVSRPAIMKLRTMSRMKVRKLCSSRSRSSWLVGSFMKRPTKLVSSPWSTLRIKSSTTVCVRSLMTRRCSGKSRSHSRPSARQHFQRGTPWPDQNRLIRVDCTASRDLRYGVVGSSMELMQLEKPISPMVSRVKRFSTLNMSTSVPVLRCRTPQIASSLDCMTFQMCVSNCFLVNILLASFRWWYQGWPSTLKMPAPRRSVKGTAVKSPLT
mmetsp:Transcript_81488/g.254373  ORF Transcript_81488/g.254373 Transcript_81488/m.254373 type:complete len:390 (-) Transcript_81488:369-1538(-)